MSRTYSVFGSLRKNGKLEVNKTNTGDIGAKKIKYQFVHFGMKKPEKDQVKEYFDEEGEPCDGVNTLDLALDEQKMQPMNSNKAASQRTRKERCNVERGYHFLMAGISKSSGEFADFFGISEEQAMRLLATIAARYPSEIKVTMQACLHR
jgi:hypothetical protein